jgi:hypothetical protein
MRKHCSSESLLVTVARGVSFSVRVADTLAVADTAAFAVGLGAGGTQGR